MRNHLHKILFIMVLVFSGCGENDPLVTDTITVSASVSSLGAGQSSVITATVKQADGKAVTGRSVSFSFVANNSGGTLTVTDYGMNNGVATAIYTAGASSPAGSLQDTVQAGISNGASAAVVISRTGSATPLANFILTLAASPITLSAIQNSVVTAKVTDGTGIPLSGVTVTFSLPTKNSGAPVLSATTVATDGSGNAITIYSPGTASSTLSIDDIVQAGLANGSTRLVTITRSGTAAPLPNIVKTLTANPTTLTAGQNSIITANVTDSAGAPLSGLTVTFSLPTKNSGAPSLSATTVVTDANGDVITIYAPGIASPTISIDDIVQASLASGSTRLVTITRSGSAATVNKVAITSSCGGTVVASNSCVVTATVTNTSDTAVSSIPVTFKLEVSGTGAASLRTLDGITAGPYVVTTDGSGKASIIYTAGATAARTDVITAAIGGVVSATMVITD